MKRIILLAVLAFASVFCANAQYAQNLKYKDLKENYNFRLYTPQDADPYHVGWTSAYSFFIPGSGQMMMKEVGRGWIFLGSSVIAEAIARNYADDLLELVVRDEEGQISFSDENKAKKDFFVILGAGLAELGIAIWSSIDANHMAKVKNMYYQDLTGRRSAVDVKVEPFLSYTTGQTSLEPAAGLSMKLSF